MNDQNCPARLQGVVARITFHNPENGWTVLKLETPKSHGELETVTVHQTKIFAGASMEFHGKWTMHPQYGRQFIAQHAIEKKPATTAALEKYLGSGLIKGVGPKTAQRIVKYFKEETMDVFENTPERLLEVPGIATKKLKIIQEAWVEHLMIRDVMIFLQGHGISTLFAVRIYKKYEDKAIAIVQDDPYCLARDFYGIGFFSADKVALSIGFVPESEKRIMAGILHILSNSKSQGHCYLTYSQIKQQTEELLQLKLGERLEEILVFMEHDKRLCLRVLEDEEGNEENCYYARSLFFDERYVGKFLNDGIDIPDVDQKKIASWLKKYTQGNVQLSEEQAKAVVNIVQQPFSVLTGGPGCGKTTTTLAVVKLFQFLRKRVLLAAPTGRASQRMSEVIGQEAKTIHRLLKWQGGSFQHNEDDPLDTDVLIVDECSMLDINLTASLLKAVPHGCQILFIGDADQLPSVGAGNVLQDIIHSQTVPVFRLTQIFRQAQESQIIQYAHQINTGNTPRIDSPFKKPELWQDGCDCLFLDSEETSQEQASFISKVKRHFAWQDQEENSTQEDLFLFRTEEAMASPYEHAFTIPEKFKHVDLTRLNQADGRANELKSIMKKVHPWSSLNYGLTAVDTVRRLYLEWIPKYLGNNCEIQILCPMTRGSLGTINLNKVIQEAANPAREGRAEIKVGERFFRVGDRVIHKRNNYDLGVFNGDIGTITAIDSTDMTCTIDYPSYDHDILYKKDDILEIDLAYAITIHKSQGSEFEAVILPILTQHFTMLYRNLLYTGLTRGKKMATLVGSRRALSMAVRREDSRLRQTALEQILSGKI